MRRHNVFLASAGLVAGILLSLASVTVLTRPASAQMDAYLAAQKGQIMAVIFMLDRAGFHGLDESLAGGTLPAGSLGTVRRARIAVSATDWPDPLQEKAKALGSELRELEEAVRAEDVGKAAGPAHEVHELEHDLSDVVFAWLGGDRGGQQH